MGYVEQQYLKAYNKPVPDLFVRCIDDYFGATSSSREELECFITQVNDVHPALKFTWNIAEDTLPFLDLSVLVQHNHHVTSLHYKATDAHNYLLHSSSHLRKWKEYIPYSQRLRLRRIYISDVDFKKQADVWSVSSHVGNILPTPLTLPLSEYQLQLDPQHYNQLKQPRQGPLSHFLSSAQPTYQEHSSETLPNP